MDHLNSLDVVVPTPQTPLPAKDAPDEDSLLPIIRVCAMSSKVASSAKSRINEMNLFQVGSSKYGEVWAVISYFLEHYKELPNLDIYDIELKKRYESGYCFDDYQLEQLMAEIKRWLSHESPPKGMEDYIMDMVDAYYSTAVMNQVASTMSEDLEDPEEAAEKMDRMSNKLRFTTKRSVKEASPFTGDISRYLFSDPRIPSGVPPIDDLTGGGPHPGEMVGMVMPSGTGKTMLATQLDEASVMSEQHVAHCSFEQDLMGDLALRLYVRASDGTKDQWEESNKPDVVFNDYPDLKVNWDNNKPYWEKYLHMFDEWASPQTIFKNPHDLFAPIKDLADMGKKVRYLILDWWGPAKYKLMQANKKSNMSDQMRREAQANYLYEIKNYTKECVNQGIPLTTIVFQQLKGAAAAQDKHGNKKHSSHDAQEDASFNNNFDYCGATSTLNTKNNTITLCSDKTRGAESHISTYKVDGNRGLIKELSAEEKSYINKSKIRS